MVEQPIRNRQVIGSSPIVGSIITYRSGLFGLNKHRGETGRTRPCLLTKGPRSTFPPGETNVPVSSDSGGLSIHLRLSGRSTSCDRPLASPGYASPTFQWTAFLFLPKTKASDPIAFGRTVHPNPCTCRESLSVTVVNVRGEYYPRVSFPYLSSRYTR